MDRLDEGFNSNATSMRERDRQRENKRTARTQNIDHIKFGEGTAARN